MREINKNTDQTIKQIFTDVTDPVICETKELPYDERERVYVSVYRRPFLSFIYLPESDYTSATLKAEEEGGILREVRAVYPHKHMPDLLDNHVYIRTAKTDLNNNLRLVEGPHVRYSNEPERAFLNLARLARMLITIRQENDS